MCAQGESALRYPGEHGSSLELFSQGSSLFYLLGIDFPNLSKRLKCAPRTPVTMLMDIALIRNTIASNIVLGGRGGALSFFGGWWNLKHTMLCASTAKRLQLPRSWRPQCEPRARVGLAGQTLLRALWANRFGEHCGTHAFSSTVGRHRHRQCQGEDRVDSK